MMINRKRNLALSCMAGAVLIFLPVSRSAAATDQYTISDNVDLVLLDASVRAPHGGYVSGLTKANFQVVEDGQAREITHFESVDAPVTIGLVVDDSGSMRPKRPEVVQAGLAFARESNQKDEFFVVNFNNTVMPGLRPPLQFTDKLQTLRDALYFDPPRGQTALYDAVAYSLRHLERGHNDKRTLIVVSDGGDNVSRTSLPQLMGLIEESRATIYAVGLFDPDERDRHTAVLRKFASVTGGQYFEPRKLDDVIPLFEKISKDVRNRYTIGYVPDETTDKRQTRTVKLNAEMGGHKLMVRSRTSYTINQPTHLMAHETSGGSERQER